MCEWRDVIVGSTAPISPIRNVFSQNVSEQNCNVLVKSLNSTYSKTRVHYLQYGRPFKCSDPTEVLSTNCCSSKQCSKLIGNLQRRDCPRCIVLTDVHVLQEGTSLRPLLLVNTSLRMGLASLANCNSYVHAPYSNVGLTDLATRLTAAKLFHTTSEINPNPNLGLGLKLPLGLWSLLSPWSN